MSLPSQSSWLSSITSLLGSECPLEAHPTVPTLSDDSGIVSSDSGTGSSAVGEGSEVEDGSGLGEDVGVIA